jgi:hypothetical protein
MLLGLAALPGGLTIRDQLHALLRPSLNHRR